ncbi:MAG: hypothetical protein ACM3JH_13500 [Acidithiobacillales bacterium]
MLAVWLVLAGRHLAAGEGANPSKLNPSEVGGGGATPAGAVMSPSSESSLPVFGVTVDRTSVSVGDSVTVTYSARIPAGASLRLDTLVTPEPPDGQRPPGGAVLEFLPPKPPIVEKWDGNESAYLWKQSVTFLPFMAGTVVVPGPHFAFEERKTGDAPKSSVDVQPPSVTLLVASRLPKDAKPDSLAPKDDRPVLLPGPSPLFWLGLAVLALLLLAAVWWRLVRKRRAKAGAGEAAPSLPPGAELLAALDRLAREAEGLGDDPRLFYAGLTHAVKRYLERRLSEPVLEWTSFETLRRLREKGIELPKETGLAELLSAADLVKFGKGRSSREAALEHVARARRLHDDLEAQLTPPTAAQGREKAS